MSLQPDYSQYPLVEVSLYLEGREVGHKFTVYSWVDEGPTIAASATLISSTVSGSMNGYLAPSWSNVGPFQVPSGSAILKFPMGEGIYFYVKREADNATAPPGVGSGARYSVIPRTSLNWSLFGVFPDPSVSLSEYGSYETIASGSYALETTSFTGIDGMTDFTIQSGLLTYVNPRPDYIGPYALNGLDSGQWPVYAGENDFRLNLGQPQSITLNITSTRWEHELVVRHSEGTSYPVEKHATQGDVSFDPNQNAWWNTYSFFDGTSSIHTLPAIPWYVEDKDGCLQSIAKDKSELKALLNPDPNPFPSKLNLLILRDLIENGPTPEMGVVAGFAPGPVDRIGGHGKVLVFADNLGPSIPGLSERFFNTCAHEIGHELKLAFRGFNMDHIPPSLKQTTAWRRGNAKYHDIGYFPMRPWRLIQFGMGSQDDKSRLMQGLMWPQNAAVNVDEWRWLRWEDWMQANISASLDYLIP
jgi:hypothetical protein